MSTSEKGQVEANEEVGEAKMMGSTWLDLPLDLVDLIASRLEFVDYIRFYSVCKCWHSNLHPTRSFDLGERPWPVLVYLPNNLEGIVKFFDLIIGKVDVCRFEIDVDGCLTLRSVKDDWAIITDDNGDDTQIFMANLISTEEDLVSLPLMESYRFHGICFSSTPINSNCVVMGIWGKSDDSVYITLWRHGQEAWSEEREYKNNIPFIFFKENCNPIFHKGLFYCLGRNGNLGIFDPNREEWTILDKPKPTHQTKGITGEAIYWNLLNRSEECCYLVESFRGHLLSIFDYNNGKPLLVLKLDESKMAWTKVENLDGEVVFLDVRNSISIPTPSKRLENRIYFTRFFCNDDKPKEGLYYCLKSKTYHDNAECDLREKAHRTWIMPRVCCQ